MRYYYIKVTKKLFLWNNMYWWIVHMGCDLLVDLRAAKKKAESFISELQRTEQITRHPNSAVPPLCSL